MYKKYFAYFLLPLFISAPAFADDAVFSGANSEQLNLSPTDNIKNAVQTTANTQKLSEDNFINAINNLDNAQVEIRERLANYNALMIQSKAAYELQRNEYRSYKKQYNDMKKRMKSLEKSKRLIQESVNIQNKTN